MSFTYKIDATMGLLYYAGVDTNAAEMFQAENSASNDPLRLPNMKIIIDLSKSKLDFSMKDFHDGIKLNRNRMEKGGVLEATAFISHSRFAKTLGDTFRLIGEGVPLHFNLFSTLSDATEWLGLADKTLEIIEIQNELMNNLKKNTDV